MKKILSLFVLLLFLYTNFFAQIRIREITSNLPSQTIQYSNTETRKIISLNNNWIFKQKDSENNGVKINIPSVYNSDDEMVFQKTLDITHFDIVNNVFRIHFLGISYSADIYLNDIIVYKKAGGNIPFVVELSNDIFNIDGENNLKLVIKKELDSQNSIPLFQRFLFPKNSGGIVRDVFLEVIPANNLELIDYTTQITNNYKSAQLDFKFNLNKNPTTEINNYKIAISLSNSNNEIVSTKRWNVNPKLEQTSISLSIANPKFWTPKNPSSYIAEVKLFSNDSLIDLSKKQIIISKLTSRSDGLFLNGKPFEIKGVTYIASSNEFGELISYSDLKKDLQIIKELGVNSVRFAKATPHPFALNICSELGLLPFVEIPLNSPPEMIVKNVNFSKRALRFANEFAKAYSTYSPLFVMGVGSGYNANSSVHSELIKKIATSIISKQNIVTYASFNGVPKSKIKGLDLYGVEVFNNFSNLENTISESSISKNNIFISGATYPNYNGNSNGYLNQFSLEAQAKFFEQTISLSNTDKLSGFFLNSMFDYFGDFNSLYTKYSSNNLYKIGILGVDKNINRIGYNVIKSRLKNSKRVTIPIGNTKDNSPMLFIIVGLILSVLTGVLINSKKKLREDAMRALLRPYNFFADIRDHRIISGFATVVLMLMLAGSHSLLIINLLYYFRTSIVFENVLIALGLPSLLSSISYLAWNPLDGFIVFSLIGVIFFLAISLIILLTSFFIRIKIYFQSIFFTVIWAVLPLAILLPFAMVLYRILSANIINPYIYGFLAIYFLWIVRRIISGVAVVFDISAGKTYLYSVIIVAVSFGIILSFFQYFYSSIYYIIDVFNKANLV